MNKTEFIERINGEITASCSLPYSLPQKEIERIIDKEMRWLYREYRELLHDRIYIINKSYYQTQQWRDTSRKGNDWRIQDIWYKRPGSKL
jgi:predicted metal-dependent hydrolase